MNRFLESVIVRIVQLKLTKCKSNLNLPSVIDRSIGSIKWFFLILHHKMRFMS